LNNEKRVVVGLILILLLGLAISGRTEQEKDPLMVTVDLSKVGTEPITAAEIYSKVIKLDYKPSYSPYAKSVIYHSQGVQHITMIGAFERAGSALYRVDVDQSIPSSHAKVDARQAKKAAEAAAYATYLGNNQRKVNGLMHPFERLRKADKEYTCGLVIRITPLDGAPTWKRC